MDSITRQQNIFNRLKNCLKIRWNQNWKALAVFSIIVLIILALFGLWRLYKETPVKAPVKFESR